MKTKQEGSSNTANGMEETKAKTSIVEDSRKKDGEEKSGREKGKEDYESER